MNSKRVLSESVLQHYIFNPKIKLAENVNASLASDVLSHANFYLYGHLKTVGELLVHSMVTEEVPKLNQTIVRMESQAVLTHEAQICKFIQEHCRHRLGGMSELKLTAKHLNALTYSFVNNEQSLGVKLARPFKNERVGMLDLPFEMQLT